MQADLTHNSLQVGPDRQLKLIKVSVPSLQVGQVLVKLKAVGICGSDIHLWKDGGLGPLRVKENYILGHEAAGEVIECGPGVDMLQPGDRVAIEASMPCLDCSFCRSGKPNLCENVRLLGVYPTDGALQDYMVHPAKLLHKLPDNISFAEGALLEPLSVAIHGIRDAGPLLGATTLICGAGAVGLLTLGVARASGAHPLLITDIEPHRLALARKIVPECITYKVETSLTPKENASRIRELCGSNEYSAPEIVLECSGVDSSAMVGFYTVRKGGRFVTIGVGNECFEKFPSGLLMSKALSIKYSLYYHDTWPTGISLMTGGLINVKELVTHVFPLERAVEAFQLAANPKGGSLKVQIVD